MVRVNIFKPQIESKKTRINGRKATVHTVLNKKDRLVKQTTVMDKTIAEWESLSQEELNDRIVAKKQYIERVSKKEMEKILSKLSEAEQQKYAAQVGVDISSPETKEKGFVGSILKKIGF